MARPAIDKGVSTKHVVLSIGNQCNDLLQEIAWCTRQSKASVMRELIKQKAEELQLEVTQ